MCEKDGEHHLYKRKKIMGFGWGIPRKVYYCKEHFKFVLEQAKKQGKRIRKAESYNEMFSGTGEPVDLDKMLEELD